MDSLASSCGVLLAICSPLFAQAAHDPVTETSALTTARFAEWRLEHGPGWQVFVDDETGYAEFVGGGSARAPFEPRDDGEFADLARLVVEETAAMTGIESATLVAPDVSYLALGVAGGTDKLAVRFAQEVDGVPVLGGFVNVLFDLRGNALSVQSTALPQILGLATRPVITGERAAALARAAFEEDHDLPGTTTRDARLVIGQLEAGARRHPALVWEVDAQWHADGCEPEGTTYWIDALGGGVLRRETSIHYLDVGGTVTSNATPGTQPDIPANPPQPLPMAHMRVTSSAGTVTTDASGAFNIPGVSGPLLCTFEYFGSFADVDNDAGAEHTEQILLFGTGNSVLLNASPTEFVTAQANAFRHLNGTRDWVRGVDPSDATADFQVLANVNLNLTCNAFFNGTSINFGRAAGPCPNIAYSTVITHEHAHFLNVWYGTGNGSDGMGEGNADLWAMYVHDTPLVGEDFCGPGCHVRDGDNLTQFCGDCCPGCHGSPHTDGEVLMGAGWKVRNYLNLTHGDPLGDDIANALFLGWLNAYDQTEIKSIIEIQWLTLDDDDGNIDNGTPNHGDIDQGFVDQGFPGHVPTGFGTALCFGDGSGTPCPCGNDGGAGEGCANGSGSGCTLTADSLAGGTLSAANAIPGQPGLFFQGDNAINGGDGIVFGDGLRCCGQNVVRLEVVVPDGGGAASTAGVQANGGAQSGDTKCYQFWYRDPNGSACGTFFNLSHAVEITWP